MKRYIFLLFIAVTMMSCLNEQKAQYTPDIYCYSIVRNNSKQTMKLSLDVSQSFYVLDSLTVGDTATFTLGFTGTENDLKSVHFTADNKFADTLLQLTKDIRNVITAESDTTHGELIFNPGYVAVTFKADYIVKQSGTPTLTISVDTDSKFSPTQITIHTPIREQQ